MGIEDDWGSVVFEDEVDPTKTLGFIKVVLRKKENPRLSHDSDTFPGVLVLCWCPQKVALSAEVQNATVRYITQMRKKFRNIVQMVLQDAIFTFVDLGHKLK